MILLSNLPPPYRPVALISLAPWCPSASASTPLDAVAFLTVEIVTDTEATNTLYNVAHFAELYRLNTNVDKTKVMMTADSPVPVHLEGVQIEQVKDFKYLGSLVQEKKIALTTDVLSQIGQAIEVFTSL